MPTSISVIWSTYNQSKLFELTLRALEAQTFHQFEVVVCDDGSHAKERQSNLKLLETCKLDARYIWQPDHGFRLARSRNNAIRCSRGQLLVFIDGDVVPPMTFLEAHLSAHRRARHPTLITGPRRWLDLRNTPLGHTDVESIFRAAAEHGYDVEKQEQLNAIRSSSPWMATRGFNLSVQRAEAIQYDEQFEGWGKEDFDLACTLHSRFGYSFVVATDTEVVHIVTEAYSTKNPWFTDNSRDIAAYVRNCVRFKRKHENVDVTAALWPLLYFEFDGETWRRRDPPEGSSLTDAIDRAEAWCGAF